MIRRAGDAGRRARRARVAAALALGVSPVAALVLDPGVPLGVAVTALAIVATLHGLGRIVGELAGDRDAPAVLVTIWGVAAHVGVAGALAAVGWLVPLAVDAIMVVGCAAGAAWLARRASRPPAHTSRPVGALVAPALLVAVLAPVMILGTAGQATWSRDLDGSYVAALQRLGDTGALPDGVSFPRAAGLGGQIVLAALTTNVGDPRTFLMFDAGVCFLLAMAWAVMAARRAPGAELAALLVPLLVAVMPGYLVDGGARWSLVVLMLGAASTLLRAIERRSRPLLLVLVMVATALVAIRHAGLACAAVMIVAALRAQRGWPGPALARRWIAVVVATMVVPYLAALAATESGGEPSFSSGLLVRGAACTALGIATWLVASYLTPADTDVETTRARRATAAALAAVVAASGWLSPTLITAAQMAISAVIAVVLVGAIDALRPPAIGEPTPTPAAEQPGPHPPALIATLAVALAICATVTLVRFGSGSPALSWSRRIATLASDARALGLTHGNPTVRARHRAAQATVPPGARLGVWVDRPDLIDHRDHRVIDVGAAIARRCPASGTAAGCAEAIVRELELRYLLVSDGAATTALGGTPLFAADGLRVLDRADQGSSPAPSGTARERSAAPD